MEKIKAYLSKDINGCVDVWGDMPKFNRKIGAFYISNDSIDIDLINYPELENLVKEGQCVEITITKGDVVYDYNESPEGKMMNTIFGGKKE